MGLVSRQPHALERLGRPLERSRWELTRHWFLATSTSPRRPPHLAATD